ncbi:MAG: hypothetical protein L3J46_01475 [Kangiellaceae bacterium]|nr:hypothetical protein [Kangiellaceae bacterium]
MNIGEISKPSVDRAQVNKKLELQSTNPVAKSKQVLDSVRLSDESKRRSKKQEKSENLSKQDKENSNLAKPTETLLSSDGLVEEKNTVNKGLKIDFRA